MTARPLRSGVPQSRGPTATSALPSAAASDVASITGQRSRFCGPGPAPPPASPWLRPCGASASAPTSCRQFQQPPLTLIPSPVQSGLAADLGTGTRSANSPGQTLVLVLGLINSERFESCHCPVLDVRTWTNYLQGLVSIFVKSSKGDGNIMLGGRYHKKVSANYLTL